jgi:hypothetical protein
MNGVRLVRRAYQLYEPEGVPSLVWVVLSLSLMVSVSFAADAEPLAQTDAEVAAQGAADWFVAAIESERAVEAQARELIRSTWAECDDCDPSEFLAQGLSVLSPDYRAVLDAYDADDYLRAADLAAKLRGGLRPESSTVAPFVIANAAAYEVKSLVAQEHIIEAGRLLEPMMAEGGVDFDRFSYFAPEMDFLRGFCLVSDLQYEKAADALRTFFLKHPQAPLRLAVPAKQMLTELLHRKPEDMGEVVDLMKFSRIRLARADGGTTVQERQQRILDLLDVMIKEAEEQEKKQCCGGGEGGGSQSKQGKGKGKPMQESSLPGGAIPEGPRRAARRANPAEVWGTMPPADRERILQALRESFPNRYRQLVEQYYEQLAKKP